MEHQRENRLKKEKLSSVSGTYGTIAKENICIIRLPKGEERDSETEILFQGLIAKKTKFAKRNKPTDTRN